MKKYFQILGLKESASYDEVKATRIKLLKQFHPDLHLGGKEYAELRSAEINMAFEVLADYFENKKGVSGEKLRGKREFDKSEQKEVKREKSVQKNPSKIKSEAKAKTEQGQKERIYDIKDREKALDEANAKNNKKKRDKIDGKKFLDISIYFLILILVVLFFVILFT